MSAMVLLHLTACSVPAQQEVQRTSATVAAASQVAQTCRELIAEKPRYQQLASRFPLGRVFDATLSQMTDMHLASRDDIASLALWLRDVGQCRNQIVDITLRDFPTALAPLVATWNKDDGVFVRLATRKVAWGKAILEIRANHAALLDALTNQTLQLSKQASTERQAELSRRVSLFSALTNLAP